MIDVSASYPRGTRLHKIQRFAQAHGYELVTNGRFKLYLRKRLVGATPQRAVGG